MEQVPLVQRLWYPIYNTTDDICVRTNAANIQYEEFSCILFQSMKESPNVMKSFLYSTYQSYVFLFVFFFILLVVVVVVVRFCSPSNFPSSSSSQSLLSSHTHTCIYIPIPSIATTTEHTRTHTVSNCPLIRSIIVMR